MTRLFAPLAGFVLVAALSACGQAVPPPPQPDAPPAAAAPAAAPLVTDTASAAFRCPMAECNVYAAAAGSCPKCGMALVANTSAATDTAARGTGAACTCPADSHCEPCKKGQPCTCRPATGGGAGAAAASGGATGGACERGGCDSSKPAGSCDHASKPAGSSCEHAAGSACSMNR